MLEFIKDRGIVFLYSLTEGFGYTYYPATNRLRLLRKQGLAVSDGNGAWILTDEGIEGVEVIEGTEEQRAPEKQLPDLVEDFENLLKGYMALKERR